MASRAVATWGGLLRRRSCCVWAAAAIVVLAQLAAEAAESPGGEDEGGLAEAVQVLSDGAGKVEGPHSPKQMFDVGVMRMGPNCPDQEHLHDFRHFKSTQVTFDNKFGRPPVIVVSVHHARLSPDHLFDVNAAAVTREGFAIEVQRSDPEHEDTPFVSSKGWCYDGVDVHWMAYGFVDDADTTSDKIAVHEASSVDNGASLEQLADDGRATKRPAPHHQIHHHHRPQHKRHHPAPQKHAGRRRARRSPAEEDGGGAAGGATGEVEGAAEHLLDTIMADADTIAVRGLGSLHGLLVARQKRPQ